MELNGTNTKYTKFSLHRSPNQNINFLLNRLPEGFGFYSKYYENICMLGDFNASTFNSHLALFLENQNWKNLIKNPTSFKSWSRSAINLILTNSSYLCQKANILKQELVISSI